MSLIFSTTGIKVPPGTWYVPHLLQPQRIRRNASHSRMLSMKVLPLTPPLAHWGSTHCRVPINTCIAEPQKDLVAPHSPALQNWKRDNLKMWARNIASSRRPSKMPNRCEKLHSSIILTLYSSIHPHWFVRTSPTYITRAVRSYWSWIIQGRYIYLS